MKSTSLNSSKSIEILKSFSPEEMAKMKKWLLSPLHNSNQRLIELFNVLSQEHPAFISNRLLKEKVYSKLYGRHKAPNSSVLNNLMSELFQQIENFLVFEQVEKNHILKRFQLRKAYHRINHQNHFNKVSDRIEKDLSTIASLDPDSTMMLFKIRKERYGNANNHDKYLLNPTYIEDTEQLLDNFYARTTLELIHEKYLRKSIVNETYNTTEETKKIEFALNIQNTKYLDIYKSIICSPKDLSSLESNTEYYLNFDGDIPNKEKRIFLYSLLNWSIQLISEGIIEAHSILLSLYKHGNKHDLLKSNGQMTNHTFINVVQSSLYMNEDNFAQEFISINKIFLDPDTAQEAIGWANSEVAYNQHKFEKCLNYLQSIRAKSITFGILLRSTNLKCQFDHISKLNNPADYNYYISTCQAFEKYIKRLKRIPDERKKSYLNFIQLTKVIISGNLGRKPINKVALLNRINREKQLLGKKWLLDRI